MARTYSQCPGTLTRTRAKLGVSESEFQTLVAVVAHQRIYSEGPTSARLNKFFGKQRQVVLLVRRGLLEAVGYPHRYQATLQAQRLLGWSSNIRLDTVVRRAG
jgi:hypothetical protein